MGLAAGIFLSLLLAAAVTVTIARDTAIGPVRMIGPAVRRWSGYVLVVVGAWFLVTVGLPTPILGG